MNRHRCVRGLLVVGIAVTLTAGAPSAALRAGLWAVALAADVVCTGGDPPNCEGTEDDDTLTGTDDFDEISGLGGDDLINAGDGQDGVYGGDGEDTLNGGTGGDKLEGGAGADTYDGGGGPDNMLELGRDREADEMHGGAGSDYFGGGGGDDRIYGEEGDDMFGVEAALWGQRGNDLLDGGPGDDGMSGGAGDDTYVGGEGDDVISAAFRESRHGRDNIHCGPGFDEVVANRNDTIVDEGDDHCEVVHLVANPKRASAAEKQAAKEEEKRLRAEILARREAGR